MLDYIRNAELSSPSFTTKQRFGLDYFRPLQTLVNMGFELIVIKDHSVWGGLFLSVFSHILVTNWSQALVANYD
jgi:hypothetical protein